MMDYDDLLSVIGDFGRYQRLLFSLLALFALPLAFHTTNMVFLAAEPNHWCAHPGLERSTNLTVEQIRDITIPRNDKLDRVGYSQCQMYDRNYTVAEVLEHISAGNVALNNTAVPLIDCPYGWRYDHSQYETTIVTEWELVCQRKPLRHTSHVVYILGLIMGLLLFGTIADCFGRKLAMIICVAVDVTVAVGTAVSHSFTAFTSVRFLLGASSVGLYVTAFVMGVETVGARWRMLVTATLLGYSWAVGYMIMAAVAYGVRDWRSLQLTVSVPMSLFVLVPFLVSESPRWLYSRGRDGAADEILQRVMTFNRSTSGKRGVVIDSDTKYVFIWDVFRYPKLWRRLLALYVIWFVIGLIYAGMLHRSRLFGSNDYVNYFIAGAVEITAYTICHLTQTRVGRRVGLCTSMVIVAIGLVLEMIIPYTRENRVILAVVYCVVKLGLSAAYIITYLVSAEILPTNIRTIGIGTASVFAHLAELLTDLIAAMHDVRSILPLALFTAGAIISAGLVFTLPETNNTKLPSTLREANALGRTVNETRGEAEEAANMVTTIS